MVGIRQRHSLGAPLDSYYINLKLNEERSEETFLSPRSYPSVNFCQLFSSERESTFSLATRVTRRQCQVKITYFFHLACPKDFYYKF